MAVTNTAPLTDTELALNIAFISTMEFTSDHIYELSRFLDSIKSGLKLVKDKNYPALVYQH